MDHSNSGVYVLDKNGGFHSLNGFKHKPIGEEIEFGVAAKKRLLMRNKLIYIFERAAIAMACLTLLVGVGSFSYQAFSVSCYVYVDVNPSVELVINNLGRVMSSQGVNEDGEELLDGRDIRGSMEDAIILILKMAESAGYNVFGDETLASITFVPGGNGRTRDLYMKFVQLYSNNDLSGIVLYSCDQESMELASSMGVSPGQLSAVENLYLVDLDIDTKEILNMSIKTIKDIIRNSFIGNIMGGNTEQTEK